MNKKIFINISILVIFIIIWIILGMLTNIIICKFNFFQNFSVCEVNQTWDEKFLEFFMIWWVIISILIFFLTKKLAKF